MSKKSILMFCPQFRPLIGGMERQAEKLAIAMAAVGYQVRIVTPRIDPESPDVENVQGVRIERFPLIDLSHRWPVHGIAFINIPYILWQVYRAVRPRLYDVDVLHTHLASLQTEGAVLAARFAKVPTLCTAATADQRSDLGFIECQGPGGKAVAWLLRQTIPFWAAITMAVEQALLRAGVPGERIVCIPNGVELNKVKEKKKHNGPVRRFLYLGRISTNSQRDIPTLIRSFERLAQIKSEVELAIVGGGDLLDETRRAVLASQAVNRIQVPGFDEPDKWLKWADCFVLPSRLEGLSNALLEAMAAGLPCIANDIPPNREVLADGSAGVLVPVGDEDRMFQEMLRMTTDKEYAMAMQQAAIERVRTTYEITAVIEKYFTLYEKMCEVIP